MRKINPFLVSIQHKCMNKANKDINYGKNKIF